MPAVEATAVEDPECSTFSLLALIPSGIPLLFQTRNPTTAAQKRIATTTPTATPIPVDAVVLNPWFLLFALIVVFCELALVVVLVDSLVVVLELLVLVAVLVVIGLVLLETTDESVVDELGDDVLMVIGPPGRSVDITLNEGPLAPSGVLNTRLRFHQQRASEVKLKYTGWVPLNGAEGS